MRNQYYTSYNIAGVKNKSRCRHRLKALLYYLKRRVNSSALRAPPLGEEAKLAPLIEELAAAG